MSTQLKVVITGATGMVGKAVLLECLDDPRVASVISVSRKPIGLLHPKLTEILHADFSDFSAIAARLWGCHACFFCLGVSSAGMSEAAYSRITYDATLAFAKAVVNPDLVFCYVSGAGTDSTEKGRSMWARVKGRTENALLALPCKNAYMFRPGGIRPMRGVRSKTRAYDLFYVLLGPLMPLFMLFPKFMTTSERVGRAMINAAADGYRSRILESADINRLGGAPK